MMAVRVSALAWGTTLLPPPTIAGATSNVGIALQNPSPVTLFTWRLLMDVSVATETSVGRREPAVVVAGCFYDGGRERFGANRA